MAGSRDFLYAALGAYDLTITTLEQVISSPSRMHDGPLGVIVKDHGDVLHNWTQIANFGRVTSPGLTPFPGSLSN